MKLVQGKNCLAVTQKDEILFAHSDIVPFLTLIKKEGKKDILLPLPECEVSFFEEKNAELVFSNGDVKVRAKLEEDKDVVTLTFDEIKDEFFIFLHAKKGETIVGKSIHEDNLKGNKYVDSDKTSVPSTFAKTFFGLEKHKIKNLVPVYYGSGYGVKIVGEVEEMDFSSDLSAKITCKTFQKLLVAVSENNDEIRNALQ